MNIYTSKQGDTLDLICHKYYNNQSGFVEKVLNANKHLIDLEIILPIGTVFNLPEILEEKTDNKIKLW